MADATYQPKVYRKNGGDTLVVASGGAIEIEAGGSISVDGAAQRIKGGVGTLDGTNPTPIDTGLSTVTSLTANVIGTAGGTTKQIKPSLGTAGTVNVYAFDGTAASAGTEAFTWIAVGT